MTNTSLAVFDTTLQKTTTWVNDLAEKLGLTPREHSLRAWLAGSSCETAIQNPAKYRIRLSPTEMGASL